jgi:glycosyltransferase involved in cell wall biosynthesis
MRVVLISGTPKLLINYRGPLLAAFAGAGHEVMVLAPGEDKDAMARLAELGIAYRAVDLDKSGLNPIKDLRTLFSLSKLLSDIHPDIVFSYNHKPIIYGSLAARRAGIPRQFSLTTGLGILAKKDTVKYRVISFLMRQLYRLSLASNDAVFFQNPDDLAFFVRSGLVSDPTQAVLINGSGVDLNYFSEAPPYTQQPVFLMMARLLKEKGVVEYAEAARILKRKHPRATFRLLGGYDNHPSRIERTQIDGWQQQGIIEYLGAVKDVRPLIASASVFVLPSYYGEGIPRSILEAMAMGRPVVTTDTPGCRETVVDEENGYLVPAKDVIGLAEAMEKFILHPSLVVSMGKISRRIAVEKYDVHKVNAVIMKTMGLSL